MRIWKISADSAPLELLALADPGSARVSEYVRTGIIFAGNLAEATIAVAVLERRENEIELMNLAIAVPYQGRGFGKQMLTHIIDFSASIGGERIVVGTGNSSLDQLSFHQKNGFRVIGVVPNFFRNDSPVHENGIRCLDLVRLSRTLQTGAADSSN